MVIRVMEKKKAGKDDWECSEGLASLVTVVRADLSGEGGIGDNPPGGE